MATYQRGIALTITGQTDFLYQSYTKDKAGDEAVAADSSGNVAAMDLYNETEEISIDAHYPTTATLPTRGDTIVIDTIKYKLMKLTEKFSNKEYATVSLSLKRYVTNGIPTT